MPPKKKPLTAAQVAKAQASAAKKAAALEKKAAAAAKKAAAAARREEAAAEKTARARAAGRGKPADRTIHRYVMDDIDYGSSFPARQERRVTPWKRPGYSSLAPIFSRGRSRIQPSVISRATWTKLVREAGFESVSVTGHAILTNAMDSGLHAILNALRQVREQYPKFRVFGSSTEQVARFINVVRTEGLPRAGTAYEIHEGYEQVAKDFRPGPGPTINTKILLAVYKLFPSICKKANTFGNKICKALGIPLEKNKTRQDYYHRYRDSREPVAAGLRIIGQGGVEVLRSWLRQEQLAVKPKWQRLFRRYNTVEAIVSQITGLMTLATTVRVGERPITGSKLCEIRGPGDEDVYPMRVFPAGVYTMGDIASIDIMLSLVPILSDYDLQWIEYQYSRMRPQERPVLPEDFNKKYRLLENRSARDETGKFITAGMYINQILESSAFPVRVSPQDWRAFVEERREIDERENPWREDEQFQEQQQLQDMQDYLQQQQEEIEDYQWEPAPQLPPPLPPKAPKGKPRVPKKPKKPPVPKKPKGPTTRSKAKKKEEPVEEEEELMDDEEMFEYLYPQGMPEAENPPVPKQLSEMAKLAAQQKSLEGWTPGPAPLVQRHRKRKRDIEDPDTLRGYDLLRRGPETRMGLGKRTGGRFYYPVGKRPAIETPPPPPLRVEQEVPFAYK